jgi:hypothetical protein
MSWCLLVEAWRDFYTRAWSWSTLRRYIEIGKVDTSPALVSSPLHRIVPFSSIEAEAGSKTMAAD